MLDMEKKQLNFSAPLLSARRYSSPVRSSGEELKRDSLLERKNTFPAKNSDMNPEEVAKPGSVPFIWEQIPGRAKSGSHSRVRSPEERRYAPRLPPGRTMNALPRVSGIKSGELNVIRQRTKFFSGELGVVRAQNGFSPFPVYDRVKPAQLNVDVIQKTKDSGSDAADDTGFSDALDALESYSMNCSASGLSASELSVTRRGNPCSDAGKRDFMMRRFLPAAKAMTLESPQYASKRQIVAAEQPQLSEVIFSKTVKGPFVAPDKNMALTLHKGQYIGSVKSEDDVEERSDLPRNISVKSCGFFPWFCTKNALRLLNPVPTMKVKSKIALASASKVGKLVKSASFKSPSLANSKHVPSIHDPRRLDPITKSCELNRIETKPNSKPRPIFYSGELNTGSSRLQARNGLSPYRNYKRSVSPQRNEAPHSPFHNGIGYHIVPKWVDQLDDCRSTHNDRATNISRSMSLHQRIMQESGPGSPVADKRFYVDTGRMDIMKARGGAKRSTCGTVYTNSPSLSKEMLPVEGQMDHSLSKTYQSVRSLKIRGNGNGRVNSSRETVLRTEDPATNSLFPPPLPKSPSESWLSRNLSTVSPRKQAFHSHFSTKIQPRKQAAQTPTTESTKWETIVKSSHLRCDYGLHSEELVARVPQHLRARK